MRESLFERRRLSEYDVPDLEIHPDGRVTGTIELEELEPGLVVEIVSARVSGAKLEVERSGPKRLLFVEGRLADWFNLREIKARRKAPYRAFLPPGTHCVWEEPDDQHLRLRVWRVQPDKTNAEAIGDLRFERSVEPAGNELKILADLPRLMQADVMKFIRLGASLSGKK